MTYFIVFVVISRPSGDAGPNIRRQHRGRKRANARVHVGDRLDNREIVFGKLISRLGNLMFIF